MESSIIEKAREFMESSRKKKKKKKNKEKGRLWNQVECKGKKRWWNPMGIRVWWTKCKRKKKEKKKKKNEMYGWKKGKELEITI